MRFSIEFYQTLAGKCPLLEFLEDLRLSDPGDHRAVLAGLDRLRDRACHREPLCKALGQGLFELRHVGKLNTRVLWFFMHGKRIVAVHGIRNKGQRIPLSDFATAQARRAEWTRRAS